MCVCVCVCVCACVIEKDKEFDTMPAGYVRSPAAGATYPCGPPASEPLHGSGGSRCRSSGPLNHIQSTAEGWSHDCHMTHHSDPVLPFTFPPVTEKLAKMQYFSFLCPVYTFRHCVGGGEGEGQRGRVE